MLGAMKRILRRSRILFFLVRSARHRIIWPLRRRRLVRRYFRSRGTPKLLVGTGPDFTLDGWLNTDRNPVYSRGVAWLDAAKPFPFADAAFDYVSSEHMIEHLAHADGARMLAECFRVLKAAGRLRIATPDLRVYVDLFGRDKSDLQRRYIEYHARKFLPGIGASSECFVLNNEMRNWGHEFLYDEETLTRALEAAGFADVVRFATGESDDPELRGVEFHGKVVGDEEMNAFETMVLEARKPGAKVTRGLE